MSIEFFGSMKTKLEIIDETVDYYSDHPRSMNNLVCLYTSKVGGKKTHCALGRCFLPEYKALKFEFNDSSAKDLSNMGANMGAKRGSLDEFLMDEYKGHKVAFWSDLQGLHDTCGFWEKIAGSNGQELTSLGRDNVEKMKEKYRQ